MTEMIMPPGGLIPERRRVERRGSAIIGELTLPEVRRILITALLGTVVLALFLWMVRTVIVAAILGLIIGFYLRPIHLWLLARTSNRTFSAILTLLGVIVPVLLVLVYSYSELSGVVTYVNANQGDIIAKIDAAVRRVPFLESATASTALGKVVVDATAYGTRLPGVLRSALKDFSVAATIFIFTAFYILIEAEKIGDYLSSKIPPRYSELRRSLETNVRGVLYGAIYSTLLTQTLKSIIILSMNLAFQVPLAGALAVLAFIIGFFPVVGSWSVYIPVAIWLLIFVALITGVYTFGLAGILLGPILIGLLKAIVDTVTAGSSWKLIEVEDDDRANAPARG